MSLADYNTEAGRSLTVRKQPPNFYTALLLVSVVALAIGCLFLFLELQSYGLSVTVSQDAKVPPPPPPAAVPNTAVPEVMFYPVDNNLWVHQSNRMCVNELISISTFVES
jgi:hypothetical protein